MSEEQPPLKKGKNFSANNVTGKRKASDLYETPFSMTRKFLQAYHIPDHFNILEPACGNNAIVRVLEEEGYTSKDVPGSITYYDIDKKGPSFLDEERKFDWIITNPPFSISQDWIKKCKDVATIGFSLLLPLSYLHGQQRYNELIFRDAMYPLTRVYVFTRFPLLGEPLREDGKYHTGMMVYAWFVWEKYQGLPFVDPYFQHIKPPGIYWIDNSGDVLKKEKENA